MASKQKMRELTGLKIIDLFNKTGIFSTARFQIQADSNIPGHPVAIGSFQYKPHAELFLRAIENHEALVASVEAWDLFWKKMPPGQLGKLSVPVGELNDAFMKMASVLKDLRGAN